MVAMSVFGTLEVQLENTAALWASVNIVILMNGQPDGVMRLGGIAYVIGKKSWYAQSKENDPLLNPRRRIVFSI
jgi:hypothetical protein